MGTHDLGVSHVLRSLMRTLRRDCAADLVLDSEWTEQTWANMINNCDIPSEETLIAPVINNTGVLP